VNREEEEEEETKLICVEVRPDCTVTLRVTKQELEAITKVRKQHPELTLSQAVDQVLDKTTTGNEN